MESAPAAGWVAASLTGRKSQVVGRGELCPEPRCINRLRFAQSQD